MCTLCCRSRAQCNAQELSRVGVATRGPGAHCSATSHFHTSSCFNPLLSIRVLSRRVLSCPIIRSSVVRSCFAVPLLLPVICFEGCACTRPYIRGATHISSHCILRLHSDWLNSLHAFYCCKRRALREHSTRFCLRLVNSVLPLLLLPTEYWYGICVYVLHRIAQHTASRLAPNCL